MKNVVLAGVGQVTLLDERKVADAEPGNFLIPCDADASATYATPPDGSLTLNPSRFVRPCRLPTGSLPAHSVLTRVARCWVPWWWWASGRRRRAARR